MTVSFFPVSASSFSSLSAEAQTRQEHLKYLRIDLFEQGYIEAHKENTFEQFINVFQMVSKMSPSNAEHFCEAFADGLQGFQSAAMALAGALDLQPSNV